MIEIKTTQSLGSKRTTIGHPEDSVEVPGGGEARGPGVQRLEGQEATGKLLPEGCLIGYGQGNESLRGTVGQGGLVKWGEEELEKGLSEN